MKNKDRERQPKFRAQDAKPSGSKTPLTFYRSAKADSDAGSPFKNKQAPSSKLRIFILSFFNWLMVALLLILLAYSLIIKPSAKVEPSSQIFHTSDNYTAATNKILRGLKYSNKVTFNENSLIDKLQEQFPEIVSARVELPIFAQTPVVHLKVANASFVLSSNSQTYIIDSEGVAVAKASDYPNAQKLIVVDDQSGFNVGVGKQVMSAGAVNFINTLAKQSERSKVAISSLTLPRLAQELDLRTIDRPYYVKFYLGGDVYLQAGQFLSSRKQFDDSSSQPAEYLDVRIPGKIFFK
jgi:cell division septal protein FtsQ